MESRPAAKKANSDENAPSRRTFLSTSRKWAMNASELDLRPDKYEMGDLPVPPVAVPGETELI